MARYPLVCQGYLTIEASRSNSDTSHSVGLLWNSDQPDVTETTQNTHKRQHPRPRKDSYPQSPAIEWPQTHASDRAVPGIDI
jgi:hypothetical protein